MYVLKKNTRCIVATFKIRHPYTHWRENLDCHPRTSYRRTGSLKLENISTQLENLPALRPSSWIEMTARRWCAHHFFSLYATLQARQWHTLYLALSSNYEPPLTRRNLQRRLPSENTGASGDPAAGPSCPTDPSEHSGSAGLVVAPEIPWLFTPGLPLTRFVYFSVTQFTFFHFLKTFVVLVSPNRIGVRWHGGDSRSPPVQSRPPRRGRVVFGNLLALSSIIGAVNHGPLSREKRRPPPRTNPRSNGGARNRIRCGYGTFRGGSRHGNTRAVIRGWESQAPSYPLRYSALLSAMVTSVFAEPPCAGGWVKHGSWGRHCQRGEVVGPVDCILLSRRVVSFSPLKIGVTHGPRGPLL